MVKPRIILADTDFSYIIPLQQKITEDYFEKIDIEVISESEYFEHFLSAPQSADILVVSEALYTPSVQRHNIKNIFLMTEQPPVCEQDKSGTRMLYKYTSVKEIASRIMGSSFIPQGAPASNTGQPKIVLVCSGCGGTGKTTVALGVSLALVRNYKRVLYINAAHLQVFSQKITNKGPITEASVYTSLLSGDGNIYDKVRHAIRNEGFCYLPPFKAALMSLSVPYARFAEIAISARESNEYDFIIIDADTVFDEDKAKLMDIADKVIIVTRQSTTSVYATNILVSNINGTNGDKYIFVCNDFDQEAPNGLTDPGAMSKFVVSEYIQHFCQYDHLAIDSLADDTAIQKVALLMM